MAHLPLYELKKTLKYIRHKSESESVTYKEPTEPKCPRFNDPKELTYIETMPISGEQSDLISRKGISDKIIDDIKEFEARSSANQRTNIIASSAGELKERVKDMIEIRNGDMSRTQKYCPRHYGTICTAHKYDTYEKLMEATTGMKNGNNVPVSSGDIYRAIPNIPYCDCNVRFAGDCVCLSNKKMDHCSCHQRQAPPICNCQGRYAGKYAEGWQHCSCNNRTMDRCICLGRSATTNCKCHSRCSCDGRKEFSYKKPDPDCLCNTKTIETCICDEHRTIDCTAHYCNCYSRTQHCGEHWEIDTSKGQYTNRYVYSYCDINVRGTTYTVNDGQEYANRVNNSDYQGVGGSAYYWNYKTCTCKTRCSCDGKKITMDMLNSSITTSYNKTECKCNYRGGENYCYEHNDKVTKRCNCYNKSPSSTKDCISVDGTNRSDKVCSCVNRTATSACSANTYTDPETGETHEYSSGYDDDGYPRCSCQSRTGDPICTCHQRTVCECVYRTGTYNRTLNVKKDILKINSVDEIQNP